MFKGSLKSTLLSKFGRRKARSPDELRALARAKMAGPHQRCPGSYAGVADGVWFFALDALWFQPADENGAVHEYLEYQHIESYHAADGAVAVRPIGDAPLVMLQGERWPNMLCFLDAMLIQWMQATSVLLHKSSAALRALHNSIELERGPSEAGVLLYDKRALRQAGAIDPTVRVLVGPRFPGKWLVRLDASTTLADPQVPCIVVPSPRGPVLMLPLQRVFLILFWQEIPSFGPAKDSFSLIHDQSSIARKATLKAPDKITYTFLVPTPHALSAEFQTALEASMGARSLARLPKLYPSPAIFSDPSVRVEDDLTSEQGQEVSERAEQASRRRASSLQSSQSDPVSVELKGAVLGDDSSSSGAVSTEVLLSRPKK